MIISYVSQFFCTMKKKKNRSSRFDCACRAYIRLLVVARICRVTIAFQSATKHEPQQYRAIAQHAITNCRQAFAVVVLRSGITIKMCTIVLSAIDFGQHQLLHPPMPHTRNDFFLRRSLKQITIYRRKNLIFCKAIFIFLNDYSN